jgi:TPP-dependent pyruvate/acetoin dehydrogenase alpha subunit
MLGARIVKEGKVTQAELDTVVREVVDEINDAVEFAKQSPSPRSEDVALSVFAST